MINKCWTTAAWLAMLAIMTARVGHAQESSKDLSLLTLSGSLRSEASSTGGESTVVASSSPPPR
jgi:hypothetical protein